MILLIELISDIGKIVVFLMLLLSVFLITAKSKKKTSNYLFAAFLLVTTFDLSGLFLSISNPILQSSRVASVLLQMPFYYLYVQSVCYFNFKLELKHFLHTLPFFVFSIFLIATSISEMSYTVYKITAQIQYYSYIITVFFTLYRFKKLYQENYSTNHQNTYKWFLQVTILFLIGNSFVQLRNFVFSEQNKVVFTSLILLSSLFALFIICWFVLKALYNPSLFVGVDKNLSPSSIHIQSKQKMDTQTQSSLQQLTDYMKNEKPYLDPELSLQKLAVAVNLSEKQLSGLINQHIGKHFFDYINEFRINDAKQLLKQQPNLTVLEILYEIGFNSKSSFYTAFKKETNLTPTKYRKSVS
ncbi:helix-turn-helix domain-containing protein [Bernardetia sp. OM2101]|uniref:helix-turn-helix domain-containing protein n=1 Tax=Bernardetia sp. OM2101 TaxID=3344876 RepID=UPI0035D0827E